MATLSITAGSVLKGAGSATDASRLAGATITAGQSLYIDSSNTYQLADADFTAGAKAECKGISLGGAASGQPLVVLTAGLITIGATVAVGTLYAVSATAGGICPIGDLTTGAYPCVIGFAVSTTQILVAFSYSGVAIP